MACKQELPPQGGYSPVTYQRIPLRTVFKPKPTMAVILGLWAASWSMLLYCKRRYNNERIEMRCAKQAITPMILAEVDRMILKQLKKNRDCEEKLMKDVKGWEVGKWKHFPVYLTLDPDEYFKPFASEYYAHTDKALVAFLTNIFPYV